MAEIALLSQSTIDKIAAGEVIERPSSVVKELVENAIDAGASAITVEIKGGGIDFIRITDNGCGIPREQVALAFLRHSTSKIRTVEDLFGVSSLGFRGEALSSIAAVSRVELITKTTEQLTGTRYVIEGSREVACEETGAPDGTTFLVKDLFYNTPARRKFLKTPHTEGNYIGDLLDKLALSHPEISFKFVNNNQTKLHTSGNGSAKDLIYHVFGREIAAALLPVEHQGELFQVSGFIGKPSVTRKNRNYENYFINRRYIKSTLIARSIEEAYQKYVMQHQYPFTVLYLSFDGSLLDVNVHPTKMELRFEHSQEIYVELCAALQEVLMAQELIPRVPVKEEHRVPEQRKERGSAGQGEQGAVGEGERTLPPFVESGFLNRKLNDIRQGISKDSPYRPAYPQKGRADGPSPQRENTVTYAQRDSEASHRLGLQVREDVKAYHLPEAGESEADAVVNPPDMAFEKRGQPLIELEARYSGRLEESSGTDMADMAIEQRLQQIRDSLTAKRRERAAEATAGEDTPPETAGAPTAEAGDAPKKQVRAEADETGTEQLTLRELAGQICDPTDVTGRPQFLTDEARENHRIIGQLFGTYWLIEYDEKLYIIDQHAAHEKVLYEQTMEKLNQKEFTSQMLSPPIILSLDNREKEMLERYRPQIEMLGYVVEPFGGREYQISGIPGNLYNLDMKELFIEMLDDFANLSGKDTPQMILEKVASMSCKAAVKGNNTLSRPEIEQLITDLLSLENPYNCPHGRPTIIAMTKYEIEKKFKRIV